MPPVALCLCQVRLNLPAGQVLSALFHQLARPKTPLRRKKACQADGIRRTLVSLHATWGMPVEVRGIIFDV